MTEIPSVSVVVPMYNSARFIGELLDSVLNQTLKNIEIIVVDDSSTDNSVEIVESYQEKFGDRLTIMKNSVRNEGAGAKRNRGLEMSRGKYIFFMDSDDVLMKTGLEEMYNIAEEFQADVVYCEKYYESFGFGEEFIKNIYVSDRLSISPYFKYVEIPTLEKYDLKQRIDDWVNRRYLFDYAAWLKLMRRDFLVKNNIKFQPLATQNDNAQAVEILFKAEKLVRIPNIFCIRRIRDESISHQVQTIEKSVHTFLERTIRDTKVLEEFMSDMDFFKENPEYKYKVINFLAVLDFNRILYNHPDYDAYEIYVLIQKKFAEYLGEHSVLISYLLSNTCTLNKMYKDTRKKLRTLEEKLAK